MVKRFINPTVMPKCTIFSKKKINLFIPYFQQTNCHYKPFQYSSSLVLGPCCWTRKGRAFSKQECLGEQERPGRVLVPNLHCPLAMQKNRRNCIELILQLAWPSVSRPLSLKSDNGRIERTPARQPRQTQGG